SRCNRARSCSVEKDYRTRLYEGIRLVARVGSAIPAISTRNREGKFPAAKEQPRKERRAEPRALPGCLQRWRAEAVRSLAELGQCSSRKTASSSDPVRCPMLRLGREFRPQSAIPGGC